MRHVCSFALKTARTQKTPPETGVPEVYEPNRCTEKTFGLPTCGLPRGILIMNPYYAAELQRFFTIEGLEPPHCGSE